MIGTIIRKKILRWQKATMKNARIIHMQILV